MRRFDCIRFHYIHQSLETISAFHKDASFQKSGTTISLTNLYMPPLHWPNKLKNKKISHCRNNSEITERCKMHTPNTHVHDRSLSWVDICTSINSGGFKLVLWAQICLLREMMRSCKCFSHLSKMPTLTNSLIIKNAIILNIMHNIFNLRDTEVVICII